MNLRVIRFTAVGAFVLAGAAAMLTASRGAVAADALLPRYYTEGREVMAAFQSVNAQAQPWTVRLVCDSQTVALGTIVKSDGWILTKASDLHGNITCQFSEDLELPAEFKAYDQANDLALLKVEAVDLPVVQWADDAAPGIGRWAVTVGMGRNPAGVGIVSAAQIEIPAEPGTGVLGIELVQSDGIPQVEAIVPESGAERARLVAGDLVEQIDGIKLGSREELVGYVRSQRPGDLVSLVVRRGDLTLTVPARLSYPSGRFLTSQGMMDHMGGELSFRRSGFDQVMPHDTVIAPNACGGPLVDLSGKAIGINIARAGRVQTLALPRSVIEPIVERLLNEQGSVPADYLATIEATQPQQTTNVEIAPE